MTAYRIAILALILGLGFGTSDLFAGDKGHKHGKGNDQGWANRDGYEYRTFSGDERPPGWSQGKKTGWGNCGMPPGQAKKHGCRTYTYEGRPYYYHQDKGGSIIVRRPDR